MKYHDGNITLIAAVDIPQFARVSRNASGQATLAPGSGHWIGVAQSSVAAGEPVAVQPRLNGGTVPMIAAAAIPNNGHVFERGSGKIGPAPINGVGAPIGRAMQAASGDNAVIEVVELPAATHTIYTASAGDDTANQADIDTGLGVNPTTAFALIRSTAGVIRVPTGAVSFPGSAGVVRVVDTGLAVNEVILLMTF
ncbi:MAG: hypothetical protein LW650_10835 [Planctomycetaceae bacterium]|jgi:hypothetical protein|nr:hypothetical protein [Planctomycetaceae bacterium]